MKTDAQKVKGEAVPSRGLGEVADLDGRAKLFETNNVTQSFSSQQSEKLMMVRV